MLPGRQSRAQRPGRQVTEAGAPPVSPSAERGPRRQLQVEVGLWGTLSPVTSLACHFNLPQSFGKWVSEVSIHGHGSAPMKQGCHPVLMLWKEH